MNPTSYVFICGRFSAADMLRFVAFVVATVTSIGVAAGVTPTWKPDRPIELIIPSSAGSGQDRTGRIVQKFMQESGLIGQPVTVINKPGGGGDIAYHYLSAGNANQLATATGNLLTRHILGTSPLNYTDFTTISVLYSEYVGFAVKADSPIKDGKDLVERVRSNPGSVTFAFGISIGNPNHIAIGLAMKAAGIDVKKLKLVTFKASIEATTALLGGHVDVVATPISTYLPVMATGKLRIIAIGAPQRVSGKFAQVPTWKEQGFDAVIPSYRMFLAPAGLTPSQIRFWDEAFDRLSKSDIWKKELEENEWQNTYMNSTDSRKYLDMRYENYRKILLDMGVIK